MFVCEHAVHGEELVHVNESKNRRERRKDAWIYDDVTVLFLSNQIACRVNNSIIFSDDLNLFELKVLSKETNTLLQWSSYRVVGKITFRTTYSELLAA